jgi:hypothetical protein
MSTLESQTGCLPPARMITFVLLVTHSAKDTSRSAYSVTNSSDFTRHAEVVAPRMPLHSLGRQHS